MGGLWVGGKGVAVWMVVAVVAYVDCSSIVIVWMVAAVVAVVVVVISTCGSICVARACSSLHVSYLYSVICHV